MLVEENMYISKRLKYIADFVLQGSKLADIGTDHAYIPTYLALNERIDFAIASDIAKGPCEAARCTINKENLQNEIEVRQADGLQGIDAGEVDTVVIAGLGGRTIIDILKDGKEQLSTVQNLILQPMVQTNAVRQWLIDNCWAIAKEELVFEDDYIYQIIFAQKTPNVSRLSKLQLEIGPRLMENKHPLLNKHIQNIIKQHKLACDSMQKSDVAVQSDKYKEYNNFILQAKEFLKCL